MASTDLQFLHEIGQAISLLSSTPRVLDPKKRIELILSRIDQHRFQNIEIPALAQKTETIRRFLRSNEIGAAKHELKVLASDFRRIV